MQKSLLPKKDYFRIVNSLTQLTEIAILESLKFDSETKNILLKNFLSKSTTLLDSIILLSEKNYLNEVFSLKRLLIERFLYLKYIDLENKYEEFDNWCFVKRFESRNKVRSFPEFLIEEDKEKIKDSSENIKRYNELKKEGVKWSKPNLEKFSKQINLSFIYKLGYDIASNHIHVRSYEGYIDFLRILGENRNDNGVLILVQNSIVTHILIFNIFLKSLKIERYELYLTYNKIIMEILSKKRNFDDFLKFEKELLNIYK